MQSTTSKVVLLAVLVVAAVGLFVVLSGDDDDSGSDTTSQQSTTATTDTAPAAPTASITVKGGEPVGGPAEIEVTKGDQVTIQVTTDADGEVHVHGYEIEKPIKAGQTVTVAFEADLDGKYEIEQHFESGGEEIGETEIAELTVQP
jgi:FtsP/CotA-like multicopper oxidase with cupredoxin domain